MVGVDMGLQVLVDGRIRVVVVDDHERDIVHACDLVGRFVLLGRTVIREEHERHLLPEPDVVFCREVEVPRDILDLIERCF